MMIIFILGSVIFFLSALLQGLSGFGFSLFALPFVTLLIAPHEVVPVMIIYSIIINIVVLYSARTHIQIRAIRIFLVFGILGLPFGTYLLLIFPNSILKVMIGIIVIFWGAFFLSGLKLKIKKGKIVKILFGFISGVLGSSISLSGPPLIVYFTDTRMKKQYFRANLALYFIILNIITIILYSANNLMTSKVFNTSLKYFPALMLGVITGSLLSKKIPEKIFRNLVLILLIISGLIIIFTTILNHF